MTRNGDGEMSDAEMITSIPGFGKQVEMLKSVIDKQKEIYRCAGELLDFVALKHGIKTIDEFECLYMRNLAKSIDWTLEV